MQSIIYTRAGFDKKNTNKKQIQNKDEHTVHYSNDLRCLPNTSLAFHFKNHI